MMMFFGSRFRPLVLLAAVSCLGLQAAPIVIDFEGLADNTVVTNQYTGVTFTNAFVALAGLGGALSDTVFPPFSGTNVLAGTGGGPVGATFTNPITSFEAYFTYSDNTLEIKAYDALNQLLGTVTPSSGCSANYVGNADNCAPNELVTVSGLGNISSITFTSSAFSSDFTVDNFTYTPAAVQSVPNNPPADPAVPEPGTVTLLSAGLAAIVWKARRK